MLNRGVQNSHVIERGLSGFAAIGHINTGLMISKNSSAKRHWVGCELVGIEFEFVT
jgi:hypothetical protein